MGDNKTSSFYDNYEILKKATKLVTLDNPNHRKVNYMAGFLGIDQLEE